MKIEKYGVVILGKDSIKVEGWLVSRELSDPPESEATNEQMVLETVIPWAQKRLAAAIMSELQRVGQLRRAAATALTKDRT